MAVFNKCLTLSVVFYSLGNDFHSFVLNVCGDFSCNADKRLCFVVAVHAVCYKIQIQLLFMYVI